MFATHPNLRDHPARVRMGLRGAEVSIVPLGRIARFKKTARI
jgi:hypothetical protein